MRLWATLLLAALLCASAAGAEAGRDGFRVIDSERGITVSVRDEPGRELPTFRGQGVIEGHVLYVLAVVLDVEGALEWAEGADETAVLRELDPRTHLIYTRTDTPWPVSDRDMVMKREVDVLEAGSSFRLRMQCIPRGVPKRDGVIRVTDCSSEFVLTKVDETHTSIDYLVNVDPGGNLPSFIINWAARSVPFKTLVRLEEQVKKTQSRYRPHAELWASAR